MTKSRDQKSISEVTRRRGFHEGDIVVIPVELDLHAYAKLFRCHEIGLYELLSECVLDVDTVCQSKLIWWTPCVSNIVKAGDWTIIGHEDFESEEESWPPPHYSYDPLIRTYWIWHKGERRRATREETDGLDEHGIAFPKHVLKVIYERLVGTVEVQRRKK